MTLEEYILSADVQTWATNQGYSEFCLYPTCDPCIERDGKTYISAVSLEDFQVELKKAVLTGEDLKTGTIEEEAKPGDEEIFIPKII